MTGSNYPLYSVGSYVTDNGSDESYYRPGNLLPVARDFHLHPFLVRNQLEQMRQSGQTITSLNIWFAHADGSKMGPMVDSSHGPPEQLLANVTALCRIIAELGYEELHVRFMDQGPYNSPIWWTTWNDAAYLENKAFIFGVRAAVEKALAGSKVARWYDLGGDRGGDKRGCNAHYMSFLWSDYTAYYGFSDTFGFGLEPLQGATAFQVGVYAKCGRLPAQYGLQIYDDAVTPMSRLMSWAAEELEAAGERKKAIVILETWYDDRNNAYDFRKHAKFLGLNLRTIVQWPLQRSHPTLQFSLNFAACAGAYQ